MKDKRIFLFFFISHFFYFSLHAQETIKGVVKDSIGLAIPNALILIKENSKVLIYTNTNTEGFFHVILPYNRPLILVISALGYESKTFTDSLSKLGQITLRAKPMLLKESVIRAKAPVKTSTDTLTFRADAYRDSTERTLEELLTKIPGISVESDGTIKAMGQSIRKILIEGDDMTGKNYQILSKSLSADLINEIQIINKFNNNKQLRGIQRSDDKVLNISLKNNHKSLFFGKLVGGLGTTERTANSLNLLALRSKVKILTFGSFNTIGNSAFAGIERSEDFRDETNNTNTGNLLTDSRSNILNADRGIAQTLGNQNVRFNRTGMGSTSFIIRPTETLRLQGSFIASTDHSQEFINTKTQYNIQDSLFYWTENQSYSRKPLKLEGRLKIEKDFNPQSTLIMNISFRKATIVGQDQTIFNQSNKILNTVSDDSKYISGNLSFSHRISDQEAFYLNIIQSSDKNNTSFVFNQETPRRMPLLNISILSGNQQVNNQQTFTSFTAQYFTNKNHSQFNWIIGNTRRSEQVNTHFTASQIDSSRHLLEGFTNQFQLVQRTAYIQLKYAYQWKAIQWITEFTMGVTNAHKYHADSMEILQSLHSYWLGTIGLRYEQAFNAFYANITRTVSLPKLMDISTGYVLNDYRTFRRGISLYIPANSYSYNGFFSRGNQTATFLVNLNVNYIISHPGYKDDFEIDTDFNTVSRQYNSFSNYAFIASGALEKYSSALSMRIKFRPSFQYNQYQNQVNDSGNRTNTSHIYSLESTLRTAFLGKLNFAIGNTITQNNVTTTTIYNTVYTKNFTLGSYLDFTFVLSDRLSGTLQNEYFEFIQTENRSYYFANLWLSYEAIKHKLTFSISGKNLLNTNNLMNSAISDYKFTIQQTKLIPRYILLEVSWRF
ncbi:MAG: hypothetical protein QM669_02130 [Siphonobacter sp.]